MMIRRLWRSTFGLVSIVAVAFAFTTLGIGIVAHLMTHEALEVQLDHRIQAETAALISDFEEEGLPGLVEEINRRVAGASTGSLEFLLLGSSGKKLAGTIVPVDVIHEGYEEFFHYLRSGKEAVAQVLVTPIAGGDLIVAANREGLMEIDRTMATLFLGALSAMLVTGIGSAALIGLATKRRLGRIDATARAIMHGDLSSRVPRDGSDSEFDRLAGVLNQMLDRINALFENLRQLSSDVAHDLRTPLTRLHNSLDLAATQTDVQLRQKSIEAARRQAAELLEIFSALLRISEIEGMAERLPRQRLDLSALVEQMGESYRPSMEEAGHDFQCSVETGLSVPGDRRLLSQAIANLLDNCIRHTPHGSQVILAARRLVGVVELTVSDNGPGAGFDDPNRLFQRFMRSERSRSTPGHGLGLALVAAIAAAHGATASIEHTNGFHVIIQFPETPAGIWHPSDTLPARRAVPNSSPFHSRPT